MAHELNATMKRDGKCSRCGRNVVAGERVASFRSRATCSHEAIHGGLYPLRLWCSSCIARDVAVEEQERAQIAAERRNPAAYECPVCGGDCGGDCTATHGGDF